MKRSDQSVAIYGILAVTMVGLVGYIVLLALGREVPTDILGVVVAAGISGVLGWARGGTYYDPTPEKVPAPTVPAPLTLTGPDRGSRADTATPISPDEALGR